jgi:hypothetical protein
MITAARPTCGRLGCLPFRGNQASWGSPLQREPQGVGFGFEHQTARNHTAVLRWGAGAALRPALPAACLPAAKVFPSGELGTRRTPYASRRAA